MSWMGLPTSTAAEAVVLTLGVAALATTLSLAPLQPLAVALLFESPP